MRRTLRNLLAVAMSAGLTLSVASVARATSVEEFPDNGSEQMGRGGAWVARATDPLAAFYNPAGLAGQETRLTLQANIDIQKTCFTRIKAANDTTVDPLVGPDGKYPQVCNDAKPFPNPQLAFTYRVNERVGLGFAVLGPSAAGSQSWPEFVNGPNGPTASPQRYLLLSQSSTVLFPTIAIGAEVVDNLRLGASVQWGIANISLSNASLGLNSDNASISATDVKAQVSAKELFIPGFTLGGIYSATDSLDVAAWYRWSAPINATGDIKTSANYFNKNVANGTTTGVATGDSSIPDCGRPVSGSPCGTGDNAKIRVPIPMEAKLGVRYHKLRQTEGEPVSSHVRDPLAQDVFDAEVDLTWANNSSFDALGIRFPGNTDGNGTVPSALPGGNVPPDADIPHNYKDVFGVRVGGDINLVPDRLAVRLGGYFESKAQSDEFQNIDFAGGSRIGFALGGTYRIHLSDAKARALEVSLGVGHTFVSTLTNTGPTGIDALSGTPCNPTGTPPPGNFCSDGRQKYRTNWPVNLGTITNAFTAINVGLSYRF